MYRERIILNTTYSSGGETAELLKKVNEISVQQGLPKARILQKHIPARQLTYVYERGLR